MSCPTCLEFSGHRDGCPEGPQPDPCEDCNCLRYGKRCEWDDKNERCGIFIPCSQCEGSGVLEYEEDVHEPDEDDLREDR